MKQKLRKMTALSLMAVMTLQPPLTALAADAPTFDGGGSRGDAGRYGQDLGDWASDMAELDEISPSDLFSEEGDNANFSGAYPSVEELESAGDSEDDAANLGVSTAQQHRSGSDSPEASAFLTAEEQVERRPPDMSRDAVFGNSLDLLEAIEDPDRAAQLCAQSGSEHTEQIVCDQAMSMDNACTATHSYAAGLAELVSGPANMASCGEGCLDVWLGKQGDNYRSGGTCTIFTDDISLRLLHPDAITNATLVEAEYDDHLRVYLNGTSVSNEGASAGWSEGVEHQANQVFHSPFGWSSGWDDGTVSCERGQSHHISPNINVTAEMQQDIVNFRLVNAVGGLGEAYARIRINYDPAKVIRSEGWSSSTCQAQAAMPDMDVQCTSMPSTDANGCVTVGSVPVCEHHFDSDAQFPGVSPLCQAVSVTSSSSSAGKTAGAPACEAVVGDREDCSLVSTECAQHGDDGSCEVQRNTYECGGSNAGFACELQDSLPEVFDDCEPTYIAEDADSGHIDYTISDVRSCHTVNTLSHCELEREVEIREETRSQTRGASCIDSREFSLTPTNVDTTIRGQSELSIQSAAHTTASIIQQPSEENGWVTRVRAEGQRQTYPESAPAEHVSSTFFCPSGYSSHEDSCRQQDGEDEDGEPIWVYAPQEEIKHYSCSHLDTSLPGYGAQLLSDWSLSGSTCHRSYSTCKTPSEPSIQFQIDYEGLYLGQDFEHFPDNDEVDRCIIDSDDFTSTQWECLDTGSRAIPSPWGGTESIGPSQLQKLDWMYPDDPYQSPHTVTVASSDQQGGICWRGYAEYNADTDHNAEMWLGTQPDYVDIYGDTQTWTNEDIESAELQYDTCEGLRDDPECTLLYTECVGDAEGHEGFCYVESEVYECGDTGQITNQIMQEANECQHLMQCEGGDCFDLEREESSTAEFAEAASMLHAVEQMGTDLSCTGVDEHGIPTADEDVNCRVFKGEGMKCKRPIGASIHGHDCCESPGGIDLGNFLVAVTQLPRLDSALTNLEGGNTVSAGVKGAYTTLREPAVDTFNAVKQPFVNSAESISGAVQPVTEPITSFVSDAAGAVRDGISGLAGGSTAGAGAGGGAGAGAGAGAAADQAQQTFSEQMLGATGAQALSVLSTAYTTYAVTMLAIQIIWECEESEFELGAKRELKSCTYVGSYCSSSTVLGLCLTERKSYCCYSSPLARIINEQAQPSFGSAKNPQCDGFTVEEFANLDWDNIDLSEWIGMLDQHDLLNDSELLKTKDVTQDNPLNVYDDRQGVSDRTVERYDGLDDIEIRQRANDQSTVPKW